MFIIRSLFLYTQHIVFYHASMGCQSTNMKLHLILLVIQTYMYHDARFRECKTVRYPLGKWCWRRFKISGMTICRCHFFGWAFCLPHQCSSSLVGFFTYMEMLCNVEICTPKSWYLCMNLLSPSSKQSKNSATYLCHLSMLIKCNSANLLSANYHFVLVCLVWFTSCIVTFMENTQCIYTGGEEATLQQANSDLQQWHTL